MCGIIVVCIDNTEKDIVKIIKAHRMLSKRGPDRGAIFIKHDKIYGFRRLSIVDMSMNGDQPFHSNNIVMMCNGEIYNHKELQKQYNLEYDSESDCECIIKLYQKIGFLEMIKVLDGVFAIVIFDRNKVYLARDRVGVRPLFYGTTFSGNFAVASTFGALSGYCNDVQQLCPCIATYDKTHKILHKLSHQYPIIELNEKDYTKNRIKYLLTESVSKRLMSNRPIACMLSGGLDSSLITSIMCKLIGSDKVRTYSIGMEGSEDLKYAKIVADYLGTKHTEVTFTPQEGFDAIPYVISDLESYDVTTVRASVGMWLLSKYISENTDDIVIMSGEGSDEIFGGYLYFHYAPSVTEFEQESKRLVHNLHQYDVLRSDMCISSHGLEPRVPFLDKNFTDFALSIPGQFRQPINGIEKHLLRKSFSEDNYLPIEVLWRRKDGFSDGVSGTQKKWYEQIQDFIGGDNPSVETEEQYYKSLLPENYNITIDRWLPKWVDHNGDPSGRNIELKTKL